MHKNLGIANINVKILDTLPNVDDSKPVFFDITARVYDKKGNSANLPPIKLENVEDDSFAAIFPSKRKMFVNNFLKNSKTYTEAIKDKDLENKLLIDWTPTSNLPPNSALGEYFKSFPGLTHDPLKYEDQASYNGPVYLDSQIAFNPGSDDEAIIKEIRNRIIKPDPNSPAPEVPKETDSSTLPKMNVVWQRRSLAGMRWGLESSPFLQENMPFWVNINKYQSPTTDKYPTILVISLGLDDEENRFDICISDNNKPFIIDYSIDSEDNNYFFKDFDSNTSRVLSSEEEIEIGVMSIAGRLIVYVNKEMLIYMKIDRQSPDGDMIPFVIPKGKIAVYGTNMSAYIHASPMIFSPYGLCELPIPNSKIPYKGVKADGKEGDSIAKLPKPDSVKEDMYGVDCEIFTGPGGSASPDGPGFHKHGKVTVTFSKSLANTKLAGADFYLLIMKSEPCNPISSNGSEIEVKSGKCPFFFRIKGKAFPEEQVNGSEGTDVSQFVLAATENFNAPDYHHIEKSASVTFYNENGVMNSIIGRQKGITISWGWEGEATKTFTGIINSCSTSQTAGMETITAECKDYWDILESKNIINSPYYDGMLAIAIIEDLGRRAGISKYIVDWEREGEFFMPQGLGLADPKVKFPKYMSIKNCILDTLKRFEAFAFFTEEGELSVEYIDGGWANKFTASKGDFSQAATADGKNLILGEKNVSLDFSGTCNDISMMSISRESRNTLIASFTAEALGMENKLLYRKTYFEDQPAYGSMPVLVAAIITKANRMFFPTLKSNFKTIGDSSTILKPLDFITLNAQPFRVMSLKRSYNAETNDFTQDYDVEWIGGNGQGQDI